MLRLRRRRLVTIRCRPTGPVVDATGGIGRLQFTSEHTFSFLGLIVPPQRRVARTASGVRLAVMWSVIPQGFPAVHEQDNLYFPDDARAYSVTAIKRYPRHMVLNVEVLQ